MRFVIILIKFYIMYVCAALRRIDLIYTPLICCSVFDSRFEYSTVNICVNYRLITQLCSDRDIIL